MIVALAVLALLALQCKQHREDVSSAPNLLQVDQDSLEFLTTAEGPAVPVQLVVVRNQTASPLSFTAREHSVWLTIFYHGTTPDTVFVSVDNIGLAAGIYHDTIEISASTAQNSPQRVAVTLTVVRGISALPKNFRITALTKGPPPPRDTLEINSTGGGTMYYQIFDSTSWLTLSHSQGVALDTLLVSFQTDGLTRGAYGGKLTVVADQAANSPLTVPCSLFVRTWGTLAANGSFGLRGIQMVSPTSGIAAGLRRSFGQNDGYIFRSSDSGMTWTPQLLIKGAGFLGMRFHDSRSGWVFGEQGVVFATSDSGKNWSQLFSIGGSIRDYVVAATDTMYAVGNPGEIRRTTDGGSTWTGFPLPMAYPANSMYFVNGHTGLVVGDAGWIMRTDDACQSWQLNPPITSSDLRQILMLDSLTGYIVGGDGTILVTIDGNKWTVQQTPTTFDLQSIYFLDRQHGWAVGASGTILRTDDGGQNWRLQQPDTRFGLFGAFFENTNRGWIAGDNGMILITYSGGDDL